MIVPVPSVNKAYSLSMEMESQRNMTNALSSTIIRDITTLMTVKGNGPIQSGRKNYVLQCDYCKLKGNTRERCYKLIGYPANYKYKRKPIITISHNAIVEEHKGQYTTGNNTSGSVSST